MADIVFGWVTFVAPVFYHYIPPNHSVNRIFSTDRVGNLGAFSLRTFHGVHLWKEKVVFKDLLILVMSVSESHIELANLMMEQHHKYSCRLRHRRHVLFFEEF